MPHFGRVSDKAGNSNSAERVDPMQAFLDAFPDQTAASFMGDREFIGNAWNPWLQTKKISHFLCFLDDMKIFDASHAPRAVGQHATRLKLWDRLSLKAYSSEVAGFHFAKTCHRGWGCGMSENANGLVCQCFPEWTRFAKSSTVEVEPAKNIINSCLQIASAFNLANDVFLASKSPPI